MNADKCLRGGQEKSNHLQNIGIALCGIVESRGVDEGYRSPIKFELVGDLDLGGARFQALSDH